MENIQAYIESGILEQYALGEFSIAERAAVEAQAAQHPEVQAELQQAEAALCFYAEAHAQTPPAGMRERVLGNVMAQIAQPVAQTAPASNLRADVDALAQAQTRPAASVPGQPVAEEAPTRSLWAMAASVALLISLGANALLYSRWQDTNENLVALQNDQARFAQTTQVVEKQLGDLRQENQVLRSDEFRAVALAGTKAAPSARARVLYNVATHKVFIDVKNLPALPAGKQYQLWALDKGKPVDAGVLTAFTVSGEGLQAMKDIASAQAFAMTVEPEGGSANPTLSTMTVMGAI